MLKYTGHPIVDVGVATITAYADVLTPEEVTEEGLGDIADYMEQQYSKNPMRSFLTVIFTNADFTNPMVGEEKQHQYANQVLRAWQADRQPIEEKCVFFGTPAVEYANAKMLTLSANNFYPAGIEALPVSGEALLALQAFPLGCIKCEGRVLLLHANDPRLTYRFASSALSANRRALNLAGQTDKANGAKYPRTQIINQLVAAEQNRRDYKTCSVTAYHLTNYRTSPKVDIYHLPLQIMSFLWQATDALYKQAWNQLVRRGWEGTIGDDDTIERDGLGLPARRNVLYEDLFALPTDARRFLRTYLLRMPQVQGTTKDDQRRSYSLATDLDLVSWSLAQLFMKEVMNVNEARIEAIRGMADKIAKYVSESGDLRLFRLFLYGGSKGQDYQELRTRLIRADYDVAPQGAPLFTFDEFIAAFENSDDRYLWLMARDLMLIRMIEQLASMGWITKHREAIVLPQNQDDEGQE